MYDSFVYATNMEPDHQCEHERNNEWRQAYPYNHYEELPLLHSISPSNLYDNFQYGQSSNHDLTLQPPFESMQPETHLSSPLQLPHHQMSSSMMTVQQPAWPSILDASIVYGHTAVQSNDMNDVPTARLALVSNPTPRKTLTDDDRRRMCRYHEEHPNTKQVEIGVLFGVERSTVSKVLRQKDKYLCKEDRNILQTRRQRNKNQDVDRALSTWLRRLQEQGVTPTDENIKDKALLFANSVGTYDNNQKALNATWLEKFKQKHHIGNSQLPGRLPLPVPSDLGEAIVQRKKAITSASTTPNTRSPTSKHGSASPPSASKSYEDIRGEQEQQDSEFMDNYGAHRHTTHNTLSLTSTYARTTNSDYTDVNYEMPLIFSPPRRRIDPNFPRDMCPPESTISPEPPERIVPMMFNQRRDRLADLHMTIAPLPSISNVNSLEHAQQITSPNSPGPQLGSPISPNSDEARVALHTLLGYFASPESEDQDAYTIVLSLTKKLDLQEMMLENATTKAVTNLNEGISECKGATKEEL